MDFRIKIITGVLLLFLGTKISSAQNITSETEDRITKEENQERVNEIKASDYVLNIKVKRKSNSSKIVITSMEYVEKQFKIQKLLEAQKRRISKINRSKRKS